MNEVYTLQRFYYEAKAILEQYPDVLRKIKSEDQKLEVAFEIEEQKNDKNPLLKCCIRTNGQGRFIIYEDGASPKIALSLLVDECKKQTGEQIIERVGIEIIN